MVDRCRGPTPLSLRIDGHGANNKRGTAWPHWQAYMSEHNIVRRSDTYATDCWDFIDSRYHLQFASQNQFDKAVTADNKMLEMKCREPILNVMGEICDMTNEKSPQKQFSEAFPRPTHGDVVARNGVCEEKGWSGARHQRAKQH